MPRYRRHYFANNNYQSGRRCYLELAVTKKHEVALFFVFFLMENEYLCRPIVQKNVQVVF